MNLPEPTFSLEQIRAAFWKTFHKEGEIFFDYLSGEEEANRCTEGVWREFEGNLGSSLLTSRAETLGSKL